MTNLLSAIDRIAFRIGSVEVAWYGILIVLGMLTGLAAHAAQQGRMAQMDAVKKAQRDNSFSHGLCSKKVFDRRKRTVLRA